MASEQPPFGTRLKAWRDLSGLTQAEAADALSVGRTYYSKLESGKRKPGKFLLEKFDLLAREPVFKRQEASASSTRLREDPPDTSFQDLMKKLIYIEENASEEQLALFDSVVEGIYDRVRRREEAAALHEAGSTSSGPPRSTGAARKSEEKSEPPPKKIGFDARGKKRAAPHFLGGLGPAFAT